MSSSHLCSRLGSPRLSSRIKRRTMTKTRTPRRKKIPNQQQQRSPSKRDSSYPHLNSSKLRRSQRPSYPQTYAVFHSPIEISSKRNPSKREGLPVHLRGSRKTVDPRFSDDFGDYNAREFRQSYHFVTDMRRQELNVISRRPQYDMRVSLLRMTCRI